MSTTYARTINGNTIYAAICDADSAGNSIINTYATKSELPDGVPAVTSSDNNKVLKASYSGGVSSYSWQPESGGDAGLKYTSVPVRTSIDETCVSLNTQFLYIPTYGPNIPLASTKTFFFLIKNPWVYGQSQYNDKKLISILSNSIPSTDYYPVWVTGSNSTTNAGHHLKVKNASWSSSYSSRTIDRPDGSQTTMRAKSINVPTPPSDISKIDTDTFDMVGDWSSDSAPIINWYLAFFNGASFNAAGGTNNLSTSCLCYMCYEPIQPKIWSNHGLAINGYNGLYVTNPLPSATSSDADKVLTVDSQGTPAWATAQAPITAGNGIDITNNVVSVDTSVVATQTDLAAKEDAFDVGTGLEMDTSGATPTLQVEAPVDIVAGPGIVIDNPDGNTLRVSTNADSFFKELYYNATNTNDTAGKVYALSEPITNFMYAKITVDNMEYTNAPLVYEIDVQHNTTSCQWNSPLRNGNVNSTINLPVCQLQINASGNLVLAARGLTYNTYPSPSFTNGDNRGMRVVRVVGIFRIAGGN